MMKIPGSLPTLARRQVLLRSAGTIPGTIPSSAARAIASIRRHRCIAISNFYSTTTTDTTDTTETTQSAEPAEQGNGEEATSSTEPPKKPKKIKKKKPEPPFTVSWDKYRKGDKTFMDDTTHDLDGVRIAVQGCGHGTLDAIYASAANAMKHREWNYLDLVIIGGDFQATRNAADLSVMSVPQSYRQLGDFPAYYSGEKVAPYPTIFVHGNHEASSHLWELYYGGWVAPNIYYMGMANVLRFGPLRIAGMSGIWKGYDYRKPHTERLPFSEDDIKKFYHVREIDVRKLLQIREPVDIGLSHDWPRGIENHGRKNELFKQKPDFKQESKNGLLGNPAATYVMDRLRPSYWFAAHLHCKFAAIKEYEPPEQETYIDIEGVPGPIDYLQPIPAIPEMRKKKKRIHKYIDGGILPEAFISDEESDLTANPDEIDLDVDDESLLKASQPVPKKAATANPDEIDLDQDDEAPSSANQPTGTAPPPPAASSASGTVSDELRAQLPASFAALTRQKLAPLPPPTYPIPGQPVPPTITNTTTRFLALDKCLPGRKYLQVGSIAPIDGSKIKHTIRTTLPGRGRFQLSYDPEWLAITRVFAPSIIIGDRTAETPVNLGEEFYREKIAKERAWVQKHVVEQDKLKIPENFAITAPPHRPGIDPKTCATQPEEYTNPQTQEFCKLLDIPNPWDATKEEREERKRIGPPPPEPRMDIKLPSREWDGSNTKGWKGSYDYKNGRRGGKGKSKGRV